MQDFRPCILYRVYLSICDKHWPISMETLILPTKLLFAFAISKLCQLQLRIVLLRTLPLLYCILKITWKEEILYRVFHKFAHQIWIRSITVKDKYESIIFYVNSTETNTNKFCLKDFSIHSKIEQAKKIRQNIATLFRAVWYIYMDFAISKTTV